MKSRGSDNISRSRKDAVLPALKENWKTVLMGDADAASRQGVKDKVDDLTSFLDGRTEAITEYSETQIRRLIEKITVSDEKLTR